jgi:hypothetical protein
MRGESCDRGGRIQPRVEGPCLSKRGLGDMVCLTSRLGESRVESLSPPPSGGGATRVPLRTLLSPECKSRSRALPLLNLPD